MAILPFVRMFGEAQETLPGFSSCSWCGTALFLWLLGEFSDSALLLSWSRMAWTIGAIIAVVAVLLIHMDRKAVTIMNPSINLRDNGRDHQKWI